MNKLFRNKKVVMATSLVLGVMMLSIPTFAELNSKTGYDRLKDSVKATAEVLTNKANNYTSEISITVKDNDKVLFSSTSKSKIDNTKDAMETTESAKEFGAEKNRYYYRDNKNSVSLGENNVYYVSEYANENDYHVSPSNPFYEENAADIEKIVDAALAGLKDNVTVIEKDSGKDFSGTISENQVPALINTVSSYVFKTRFLGDMRRAEQNGLPQITNDIYIKSVSGKATANKQGILENLFATATLSGKEKNGTNHDLSVEILIEVSDVNKTAVNFPDLAGKKVEKNIIQNNPILTDVSSFVGKYKSDIVVRENGKFVKIGERNVTIAHGDSKTIEGRYYEVYLDGYSKNHSPIEFTFSADFQQNQKGSAQFTFTNSAGKVENGHIYLNQNDGNINFYIPIVQNNVSEAYSGNLFRVYDK